MAKETPYLDVQQLTKSFGSLVLFENISFSIAEGQKVGLIAKNGTGKSTLLSVPTLRKVCWMLALIMKGILRKC